LTVLGACFAQQRQASFFLVLPKFLYSLTFRPINDITKGGLVKVFQQSNIKQFNHWRVSHMNTKLNIPPDPRIIVRSDLNFRREDKREPLPQPQLHTIPGKTMKLCPHCLKKRKRSSKVIGPFYRNEFPKDAKELKVRCSDHWVWRCLLIWWLVSPLSSREGKVWYEIHFFATCRTYGCPERGLVRVEEREGIRRLSRLKRFENLIRHLLNDGVERIWPTG
jgi:hypothetical protein